MICFLVLIGIALVLNEYVKWREYCLDERLKNIKKEEKERKEKENEKMD